MYTRDLKQWCDQVALGSTRVRVLQDLSMIATAFSGICCVGLDPSEGTARVLPLQISALPFSSCVGLDPSEGTASCP